MNTLRMMQLLILLVALQPVISSGTFENGKNSSLHGNSSLPEAYDVKNFLVDANDIRRAFAKEYMVPNMYELIEIQIPSVANASTKSSLIWNSKEVMKYLSAAGKNDTKKKELLEKLKKPLEDLLFYPLCNIVYCDEKTQCLFGSDIKNWSNSEVNGEPGSKCSDGYYNNDGLCSQIAPTTNTSQPLLNQDHHQTNMSDDPLQLNSSELSMNSTIQEIFETFARDVSAKSVQIGPYNIRFNLVFSQEPPSDFEKFLESANNSDPSSEASHTEESVDDFELVPHNFTEAPPTHGNGTNYDEVFANLTAEASHTHESIDDFELVPHNVTVAPPTHGNVTDYDERSVNLTAEAPHNKNFTGKRFSVLKPLN